MTTTVVCETKYDPLEKYEGVPEEKLQAACGLIPMFWMQALVERKDTAADVMDSMVQSYGFGRMEFKGCSVQEDGTYESEFAEDPDLHPYVTITADWAEGETVELLIYQYGILAVRDSKTCTIVRMD